MSHNMLLTVHSKLTVKYHSEPVVAHAVMADRLPSAQSVKEISLT